MIETTTPRVWIGALGAYNAGHLIGRWTDATDADELHEVAAAVIAEAKRKLGYEGGEEFACFDREGFGDLIGEYDPLDRVAAIGALIEQHGAAFIAWAGYESGRLDDLDEAGDAFESSYRGEWDSEKAFAENYADETGMLDSLPDHLSSYFDFDALARDLFIEPYTYYDDGGFVFEDGC